MDTASVKFVLFGLCVAILSNLSRSAIWRSIVLSLASVAFLALLSPHLGSFLPLLCFLLLGYAGIRLQGSGRSRLQAVSVLTVVFAYIWLKKYTFLPENILLKS